MSMYYIYIITNTWNSVLYIGVTNNIYRRILEHKKKINKGFASKYNLSKLIYYEDTHSIITAIEREKQLKRWHRKWKENLIHEANPDWKDLSYEIGI